MCCPPGTPQAKMQLIPPPSLGRAGKKSSFSGGAVRHPQLPGVQQAGIYPEFGAAGACIEQPGLRTGPKKQRHRLARGHDTPRHRAAIGHKLINLHRNRPHVFANKPKRPSLPTAQFKLLTSRNQKPRTGSRWRSGPQRRSQHQYGQQRRKIPAKQVAEVSRRKTGAALCRGEVRFHIDVDAAVFAWMPKPARWCGQPAFDR